MAAHEKRHIQNAFSFELGKVQLVPIRQRMVDMLLEVDEDLAKKVADHLGLVPKKLPQPITGSIPADGNPDDHHSLKVKLPITEAPSVSMANKLPTNIKARRIAILTADGVDDDTFTRVKKQLCEMDAMVQIIAPRHGFVTTKSGDQYPVDDSLLTAASVVFDAVYVAGGESVNTLLEHTGAVHFVAEAYKHCKPIGADENGAELFKKAIPNLKDAEDGVITNGDLDEFTGAIMLHRFWDREMNPLPA